MEEAGNREEEDGTTTTEASSENESPKSKNSADWVVIGICLMFYENISL
jgi:hypothetical protein